MNAKERIARFIAQNFYLAEPLAEDTSLLERGIVDSTGVLEVIAFLEKEFGIRVEDDETTPENLDSVARIAAYVERKSPKTLAAPA